MKLEPTCAGNPELWFSSDASEKLVAIDTCLHACPLVVACRREAEGLVGAGFPVSGIWGGREFRPDRRAGSWVPRELLPDARPVDPESLRRRELRAAQRAAAGLPTQRRDAEAVEVAS